MQNILRHKLPLFHPVARMTLVVTLQVKTMKRREVKGSKKFIAHLHDSVLHVVATRDRAKVLIKIVEI